MLDADETEVKIDKVYTLEIKEDRYIRKCD